MSLRIGRPKVKRGESFDLVIVGGGPAGLSAAIYASRFLLKTVVLTVDVGGQLNLTNWVEDYPGLGRIQASELVEKFRKHAESFGVNVVWGVEVKGVERVGDSTFKVTGTGGVEVYANTVLLAVGARRRKLGVPGEEELVGKGVSYCSVCDAPLFKGSKAVAVVGGGDSALEGASLLSSYVGRVYLIHRRDSFRAKPFLVADVKSRGNVEFLLNSVVTEIIGGEAVRAVKVLNKATGEEKVLDVEGVFIEIGFEPSIEFFKSIGLETDDYGYVKVDEWMRTNIPGVFAAGDAISTWRGFRQIVTAAATGAVAAYSAYQYLIEKGLYRSPDRT
ncbi:MAG: thioredoxin-disulfide reductase [Thermoprotei archaeon]|nr:thioredoxin-disulfide reductase [Thermoprotei archaeon]